MGVKIIKDETLRGIADAIRDKMGTTESIKTNEMAAAIGGISSGGDDRYDAGFADGKVEGIEEGKQSEYDRFWDAFQDEGRRTGYESAFEGEGWSETTFKPKYAIRTSRLNYTFENASNLKVDLREYAILDASLCVQTYHPFNGSGITAVGVMDLKGNPAGSYPMPYGFFYGATSLETVEKIIFYPDRKYRFDDVFYNCSELKEVRFEGELRDANRANQHLNFQHSTKLSKESIISCVNVLSTNATGHNVTFSKIAVDKAFETSENANDGSVSGEWTALAQAKPGWTILLYEPPT